MFTNAAALLAGCLSLTAAAPETRLLTSFETPADLAALHANHTELSATQSHATDGTQGLRVNFLDGEYPNVQMVAKSPWDFSGLGALVMDITNPGTAPLNLGIRVDDDTRADGSRFCVQADVAIEPGQTLAVAVPLTGDSDPMKFGMRALPPVAAGVRALTPSTPASLNMAHVVAWQVFMHRPKLPASVILDHVRVVAWNPSLDGIVDEFGQYAKVDWPGKLKSAGEFVQRRASEESDRQAHPALPDRDRFGGWTGAPAREASGFFRVEKINGKWWLVTPEGHLFFSAGMDCVNLGDSTVITGRENMFTWLPGKDDALARHRSRAGQILRGPVREGDVFSFFTCNLERKFGKDYQDAYFNEALSRLTSWGFNTIGNWSDHRIYANGKVPYVATIHVSGDHHYVSSGTDYWGKMHDPFDPKFREDAAREIQGVASRIKTDPWCVGWFVDNELSWGGWGDDNGRAGLAIGALAEDSSCHAKLALIKQLKGQYGPIAALNSAWDLQLSDWSMLEKPFKPALPLSDRMKADLFAFVKEYARQYFRVVRDELHKADPSHLYLGCRFAWHTPEAVAAAAEICDVISANLYYPRLDPERFPLLKGIDKPCIIGEFHFGALDRGMFHTGLVSVPSQQARAAMYIDYLRSVADHPNFVGCHWFQYVDEPLTGRSFDGENYQIGFVNVTDTPYPETVEAARAVHAEIYPRRWK